MQIRICTCYFKSTYDMKYLKGIKWNKITFSEVNKKIKNICA